MKIVILGPAHPLRGGIAIFNERLARQFQNEGHDVTIYSFSLQYPDFLFPGTTQYSSEPAPADLNINIKVNSINPINWLAVGNEIKNLRPDLVVVRYWLPLIGPALGTILRRIKSNKQTKIVCIADNVVPHEKRFGDHAFTKYFIKPVDAFITMSEKVLSDLRMFTQTKPAILQPHPLYDVFGNAVSKQEARTHLGIDQTTFVFLFFGFIRKYKGLDMLLEAFAQLKNPKILNPNSKLLIAGEFYEDRKQYDELIEKLQLKDDLILKTEFIADSEVKYYLCAADAVVQPYRNATQSGVTPLAYHFEIPMIVTNVGGLPAFVPHGKVGLVCEPTVDAIAAAMQEYMQTGSEQFLPYLRDEKKKYGWDKMTAAVLQLAASV
ncbi:glycosyltransferase family 4 protein [Lacibacter sediminis]|uniref:Glycosyltransferase family 4 protein n=1 Tax=Lacibacter sediminis TaxID=2760713 RepID=A0A7G5XB89_9BACT|nr:glycosyltransferase family 4 protein [Lacibacter sediminis]QNA42742.1 glycosyltransferase family 4 protein [Lacibacter sediminis]